MNTQFRPPDSILSRNVYLYAFLRGIENREVVLGVPLSSLCQLSPFPCILSTGIVNLVLCTTGHRLHQVHQ